MGAYERPYSGVGIEYFPLGTQPDGADIILHETGFLPENKDWDFPSVFSPFWRLYYNGKRGHCVIFGDRIIELTPNRLVLIPDHHKFHCFGLQPVPSFWLAFSTTRHVVTSQPVPIILKPRKTELYIIRDLQQMITDYATCEQRESIYRFSLALLHVVLCRPEIVWQPPISVNLLKIMEFMQAHMADKLTNPLLARQAGLSVKGLAKAIRRHFDTSPARFVSELRIREACQLLLKTDISIERIAEATGFPNRAYFSRVFKRITAQTPAAFRACNRPVAR